MKLFFLWLICLVSFGAFSQNDLIIDEEFVPITIADKDAFISTKTGEYVFRSHADTDPKGLKTTDSGVFYSETFFHIVKKGESLYGIAKNHGQSIESLKKQNNLKDSDLKIGQKLKIVKKIKIDSSSPVISSSGDERIIAKLNPGQSPYTLNPPVVPSNIESNSEDNKEVKEIAQNDVMHEIKVHTVKKGETLFGLAKKYKITVQKLKDLNNLTLNNLSIGQKLQLQ